MAFKLNWHLDEGKFLTKIEVNRLVNFLKKQSGEAIEKNIKVGVRDWLVIDLGLSTGLRVSEMANLCCGDVWIDAGRASLMVRKGKCGKQRIVKFGNDFKEHLTEYLAWKQKIGEECNMGAPLIISSNTREKMTTRGLQKVFERNTRRVGIQGHSIHSLRHTYATFLLRASQNLRLVQKQLGHSSVMITEIYADILNPDLEKAVQGLYR